MLMLMALAAPALAIAAAADPAADPQSPDLVIVTGERLPEGAAEIISRPGGTDLVAASEYRDRAAVSLRDALAFSPGVYAQPRFGQEIRLSIRGSGISRGFHMRGLTLLLDGVPINLADDNGDFQELDPTVLDRLEVYRGANAFRFGGTTLGGRDQRRHPDRADRARHPLARRRRVVRYAAAVPVGWVRQRGLRRLGGARRRPLGRRPRPCPAQGGALHRQSRLGAQATASRPASMPAPTPSARNSPAACPTPQFAPGRAPATASATRRATSIRCASRTAPTSTLGTVDIEGGAFLNVKSLYHPIFQVVDQDSVDRGLFGRAGWIGGKVQLWAGATARFGTVDARRFVNVAGKRGARTFEADQKARTIDVYGEGRLTFGDLTAIGGIITTFGRREQKQVFPVAVRGSASFSQVSPRLGLLWEPRDDLQVYANVSRSHELPGFIELAQVAAFVPLKAQHAWTGEVGARGKLGPVDARPQRLSRGGARRIAPVLRRPRHPGLDLQRRPDAPPGHRGRARSPARRRGDAPRQLSVSTTSASFRRPPVRRQPPARHPAPCRALGGQAGQASAGGRARDRVDPARALGGLCQQLPRRRLCLV